MSDQRKIGFFGLMKPFDSAECVFERLPGGGMRASINHDLMSGMTIDQLIWWFHNIDQRTTFNGQDFAGVEVDCYKLWHPHDHVKVRWHKRLTSHDGQILSGSVIHIQEKFGSFSINEQGVITQFDRTAFNFEMRVLGLKVGHLLHLYQEVDLGVKYYTELEIECRAPIVGRFITWLACKFFMPEPKIRAWMVHNVEEVGESEKFIPQLYSDAMSLIRSKN